MVRRARAHCTVPEIASITGHSLTTVHQIAEPLLVLEDALAELVPSFVEQMHLADLVHPLLGRMVRRVRGAGSIFYEDRLVRLDLVHARQVVDGIVGRRGDQVPGAGRLALERIDPRRVAEQVRLHWLASPPMKP